LIFQHSSPVSIGAQKQLFLDDLLIGSMDNVQRVFPQPTKHPANPIIIRDRPWDAGRCDLYGSATYDPVGHRLQVFYSAVSSGDGHDDRLGYAESCDGGLTWAKPDFALVAVEGQLPTNIVMDAPSSSFAGPAVFRDAREADPSRRYKMFTSSYPDRAYLGLPAFIHERGPFLYADHSVDLPGLGKPGMYVAYSPDGIHWARGDEPFSNLISDTGQSVMWDERVGKYVAYVRARTATGRSVARMESDDFENWSEPQIVMTASDHQLYSMGVTPYAGVYLGTPWICWNLEGDTGPAISPEIAFSRDGIHWQRPNPGVELIPTRAIGSADELQIRMASSLVVLEDRILFFYGQTDQPHTTIDMQIDIGMASLRRDGFAAIVAGEEAGTLRTNPLIFSGGRLCLNLETEPTGSVAVRLLEADGARVVASSHPLSGDDICQDVSWLADFNLADWAGKPVLLEFALSGATLYAFQFLEDLSVP
jgi:hypothetical protein